MEVKTITTRKLRRRPNDPTPIPEKRRKPSPDILFKYECVWLTMHSISWVGNLDHFSAGVIVFKENRWSDFLGDILRRHAQLRYPLFLRLSFVGGTISQVQVYFYCAVAWVTYGSVLTFTGKPFKKKERFTLTVPTPVKLLPRRRRYHGRFKNHKQS